MTLEHWRDQLDRHGADLTLWPSAERAEAKAFLAFSAQARADLDALRTAEDWLRGEQTSAPMDVAALAAAASRPRQPSPGLRLARIAPWAAAACVCLSLGLAAGVAMRDAAPADSFDFAFGPEAPLEN